MLEGEVDVEAQGGDVVDDVDAEKKEKQKILGLNPRSCQIISTLSVHIVGLYFMCSVRAQIVCI